MEKVWVIAYINRKFSDVLEDDLNQHPKYAEVTAYIPHVKILKKKFKGKQVFEYEPMMFNYGFFHVPKYFITNPKFMIRMRLDIRGIYAWVKDNARISQFVVDPEDDLFDEKLLNYIEDNKDNPEGYALARDLEIKNLVRVEQSKQIYSSSDINALHIGQIITLRGYPFDDIEAEIVEIYERKRELKVRLLLDLNIREVTVSFDNVFYTVYKDDLSMKEISIEELNTRESFNLDKVFKKQWDEDEA